MCRLREGDWGGLKENHGVQGKEEKVEVEEVLCSKKTNNWWSWNHDKIVILREGNVQYQYVCSLPYKKVQ